MSIGDIVQVNDLCVITHLHDAIGTVVAGPIYKEGASRPMIMVLINGELITFRDEDAQLEVVNASR